MKMLASHVSAWTSSEPRLGIDRDICADMYARSSPSFMSHCTSALIGIAEISDLGICVRYLRKVPVDIVKARTEQVQHCQKSELRPVDVLA